MMLVKTMVALVLICLVSSTGLAESGKVSFTPDELVVAALKQYAEKGVPSAQYELAKRHLTGQGVETNREFAQQLLVNAIMIENTDSAYSELLEKEFGWRVVSKRKTTDETFTRLINTPSLVRDGSRVWYWSLSVSLSHSPGRNVVPARIKTYEVLNCNNKTKATKALKVIDFYLKPIEGKDFTINDQMLEYKPLDISPSEVAEYSLVCTAQPLEAGIKH